MTADADRGLLAVRRVREARERDSRLGLRQMLAATRLREAEAVAARIRLAASPAFGSGTVAEYRAHTLLTGALAAALAEAEEAVRRSATVAEEGRRRWGLDWQALRTAELVLERRAAQRNADRVRREAAHLDELAAQGWLHQRTTRPTTQEETT